MLRYKQTLITLGATLILTGTVSPQVFANTLTSKQQEVKDLKSESSKTLNDISNNKQKAQGIQKKIQSYEASINHVQSTITTTQQQLHGVALELQKSDQNIAATQQQLGVAQQKFKYLVTSMYEDGQVSYLAAIFSATSWDDLVSRLNMMETVSQEQKDLAEKIMNLQQQLQKQKASQQSIMQSLQSKSSQLETLKQTDEQLQSQQRAFLSQVNHTIKSDSAKQSLLESQIQLTQSQVQQIEAETIRAEKIAEERAEREKAMRQRSQSSSSSTSSTTNGSSSSSSSSGSGTSTPAPNPQPIPSVSASSLIQYAETFVGLPYVWGGTTPNPGFDCSGFTQYVFQHFGISLPRIAADQFADGVPVDQSQLQPGDLVFFSTYAPGATHVGIYIGNDMMVDSEDAGLIVTNIFSSSYWAPKYIGARRILN